MIRIILIVSFVIGTLQAADLGPPVGSKVPAFAAPDQHGTVQGLDSIKGPKGAMLVFYRSADWCPYCKGQLVELENSREHLRKQGLGIAAISYDSVAILDNFAKRKSIQFPLLADPESKVIRAFGILNDTIPRNSMAFGIPHPMTIIVDATGKVLSKHFEYNVHERYTAANILTENSELRTGAAATEIETKHLKLRASASNENVGFGERIRLILDIELKPKMHVYAPTVEGYVPIEWFLPESPTWKQHPIVYPPTKMLTLPAIEETVPVYDGKFTLQREITFGKAEAGDILVKGTLRYQACDDRVCYIPQSVPIQWKLHYEPLDSERAPKNLQHTDPK